MFKERDKLISTGSPGSGVGVCVGVLELTELTLKIDVAMIFETVAQPILWSTT